MKNILFIVTLSGLVWGCNTAAPKTEAHADTVITIPKLPPLPEAERKRYEAELTPFFEDMLLNRGFSGGILVAKDGQVVYEKYAGYSDLAHKQPISDTSSLHIASTSKTFMGIAILGLVQNGVLSLEDSIQKFFPGLPYPPITVKMLLNHRSGLPNYLYFMSENGWDKSKQVTNDAVLHTLYTERPGMNFKAGTRFSYSNTNYVLLAMIMEKLTAKPYPQYMKEKYFQPLHMDHTFVFSLADTVKVIPSFNYNGTEWATDFLEGTYGDKNIYSTPHDLLKWDQALYTESLVNQRMLDSAFAPYSLERPSVHNYGLGFRMLLLPNGKKVVYHFGRWHGNNSAFARLLDEKATVIILGNKFNRNIYNTAHVCYDFFGQYLQAGNDEESEPAKAAPRKRTVKAPVKKKTTVKAKTPASPAKKTAAPVRKKQ